MPTRIAVAFIALMIFFATQLASAQTQASMTGDACAAYKKADAELNKVYQQILQKRAKETAFINALKATQRAWIAFRDAELKAVYPDPDPAAYGSAKPMCDCSVLEGLTQQRTQELRKRWIEGTQEGDVCAGSSPIK